MSKLHYGVTIDFLASIDEDAFGKMVNDYEIESPDEKTNEEIIREYLEAILRSNIDYDGYINTNLKMKSSGSETDRMYYTLTLELKEPLADENIEELMENYDCKMSASLGNEAIVGEYIYAILRSDVFYDCAINANIYVDMMQ